MLDNEFNNVLRVLCAEKQILQMQNKSVFLFSQNSCKMYWNANEARFSRETYCMCYNLFTVSRICSGISFYAATAIPVRNIPVFGSALCFIVVGIKAQGEVCYYLCDK